MKTNTPLIEARVILGQKTGKKRQYQGKRCTFPYAAWFYYFAAWRGSANSQHKSCRSERFGRLNLYGLHPGRLYTGPWAGRGRGALVKLATRCDLFSKSCPAGGSCLAVSDSSCTWARAASLAVILLLICGQGRSSVLSVSLSAHLIYRDSSLSAVLLILVCGV